MDMKVIADRPLVSIITPTYNQAQFIEATILSVLGQSYPDIEYIVIDGMSTDATPEVVARYQDRISLSLREPDQGQSDAIVKGFRMAKGDLVGWINSDDLLYPDCVARIVEAYRKDPDAVLFYGSDIDIIDAGGAHARTVSVPMRGRDALLNVDTTMVQPGSFYKRSALVEIDYFDTSLRYSMDLDLWLRLLTVGGAVNVCGAPVAAYREWGGTKTLTGGERLLKERAGLLQRHGAASSARTLRGIRRALLKEKLRKYADRLGTLPRFFCSCLYYGAFIHLPASNSRRTRFARALRRLVCKPLFLSAGRNINVEQGARFGSGRKVTIGDNSGIGIDCRIMGTVSIGNNVMIGPEVMFLTTSHRFDDVDTPMIDQGYIDERPIRIEDDVWIGARCIFLPGVTVGSGSVIGAGSIVTRDVPARSVAAGNPARVIRQRS